MKDELVVDGEKEVMVVVADDGGWTLTRAAIVESREQGPTRHFFNQLAVLLSSSTHTTMASRIAISSLRAAGESQRRRGPKYGADNVDDDDEQPAPVLWLP